MGHGIAANLAKAGLGVDVWDTAPGALKRLEKKKNITVATPGEMAARCAVIFFVVPASPQIDAALKGRAGVLAKARKGLAIYDFTTSDPAVTRKLARRAAKRGVAYLDAGMSGGAAGADAGTLTLMAGGDKAAFRRTRKYLTPIADKVYHVGPSGAGHTLKLVHNMVCHTIFLATCEGGKLAERAGIDLADMIEVFNVANARSYASEVRFPAHILSGKWDARSRVYNLHKDLDMAVRMGRELGADVTLGNDTRAFLKRAISLGMEETDYSLLYRDFDKIRKPRKSKRK